MRKLLFLLLLPLSAFAQIPASQDTTLRTPNTVLTPQWRAANYNGYRVYYLYNPALAKYDFIPTGRYLRDYYASLTGNNTFGGSQIIVSGTDAFTVQNTANLPSIYSRQTFDAFTAFNASGTNRSVLHASYLALGAAPGDQALANFYLTPGTTNNITGSPTLFNSPLRSATTPTNSNDVVRLQDLTSSYLPVSAVGRGLTYNSNVLRLDTVPSYTFLAPQTISSTASNQLRILNGAQSLDVNLSSGGNTTLNTSGTSLILQDNLTIGSGTSASTIFLSNKNITGGAIAAMFSGSGAIQSDVTNTANIFRSAPSTQVATFTLPTLNHYLATMGTVGAGSSITNVYGFNADATLTSGANNYGFFGNIVAATNRWNFYASATAQNYFRGNTGIGPSVSVPTAYLHLGAGTATAGNAPLKINGGTLLGITEAGTIENDGTHLYYTATNGGTRYQLDQQATTLLTSEIHSFRNITSATTVLASDATINVTSGTFTQPLPTTTLATGQEIYIKNSGSGIVTITATGMDGQTSIQLSQYDGLTLQYTGVSGVYIIK